MATDAGSSPGRSKRFFCFRSFYQWYQQCFYFQHFNGFVPWMYLTKLERSVTSFHIFLRITRFWDTILLTRPYHQASCIMYLLVNILHKKHFVFLGSSLSTINRITPALIFDHSSIPLAGPVSHPRRSTQWYIIKSVGKQEYCRYVLNTNAVQGNKTYLKPLFLCLVPDNLQDCPVCSNPCRRM